MPILRVDSMGRLYESSPDRADGLGYGGHAPGVTQGDMTYGATYLKSQQQYQQNVMRDKQMQAAQDRLDAVNRDKLRRQALQNRQREMMQGEFMKNPKVKNAMIKRGLAMGCNCAGQPGAGQPGAGQPGSVTPHPDQTQQAIKQLMNTGRSNLAGRISKDEALQNAHATQANRIFAQQANAQAQAAKRAQVRDAEIKRQKMIRQSYDASPSTVIGKRR
jgi:hypothetical protein